MYGKFFKVRVKPKELTAFIKFVEWDIRVAREREPGTLRFDLYQDPADENTFFVYEAYRDKKAFEDHQNNPPYQEWKSRVEPEMFSDHPEDLLDGSDSVCSFGRCQ